MPQNASVRSYELTDKITTFIVVNMLWLVFVALVVTLPAGTAGLFATLVPWTRGQSSEPFRDFFGGMRQYWRQSTVIVVLDAILAGVIALNLAILSGATGLPALCSRNVAFFVAAVTIMTNLYLWPLLVSVDWPVRRLIRVALTLVFLHPVWSLVASGLALLPLLLAAVLPRFVSILVSFSSCALLASWGAQHVFDQHQRDLFDHS